MSIMSKKKIRKARTTIRELGSHNTPIHLHEAAKRVRLMRKLANDSLER